MAIETLNNSGVVVVESKAGGIYDPDFRTQCSFKSSLTIIGGSSLSICNNIFAVEAILKEVSTISVKLVNNCMSDEPDCARRQITDIRTIAEDVGFHGTRSTHYDDEWVYTQTIIYEDKMKSGEDVLAFQIVSENYAEDDRGRYEIYDYGYHYNTIANDFYQNTDPVISTDDFDQAKHKWIERVKQKRVKIFEDDIEERNSEQDTTLNDF